MRASEAMTRYPHCCTPETSLEHVARMMIEHDCGAIPVVGDLATRFPVGIITDRDIVTRVVAVGISPALLAVRDCMTAPPLTVAEDTSLSTVIDLLEERQIRRVIVTDHDGRVSGIIAAADVAAHASRRKAGELLQQVSMPSHVYMHH